MMRKIAVLVEDRYQVLEVGRKATCFFAIKNDLVNAGAEYLDEEVVVDGNLITSRNPYDLPAFCREVIAFLRTKT
jgi:protease I